MMKRMIVPVAGLAVLLAAHGSALAQTTPMLKLFDRADANHDGRLDKTEIAAARGRLFDRLDRNGDGSLDPAELQAAGQRSEAASARVQAVAARRLERLQRLDTDGDGSVSRTEYMAGGAAFARLDRDGDGVLSRQEVEDAGTLRRKK